MSRAEAQAQRERAQFSNPDREYRCRCAVRWPVAVIALSAVTVTATLHAPLGVRLEDARDLLTSFEWWRPLSGHLVHAGPLHLLLNLALFVPLGVLRERRVGTGRFLLEFLALAVFVAVGIRLLHSHWETYRGLSGVVYGLLTVLALGAPESLREDGRGNRAARARRLGLTFVAVLAAKSALEYGGGGWLAGTGWLTASLNVTYLPGSHCAGIAGGLFVALLFPSATPRRSRRGSRDVLAVTGSAGVSPASYDRAPQDAPTT